ncbi:unnamed protein product [Allacma fusca]|uniref:NADH dehydrogenase [ubiquinone] 1 alpha subcomplex subunit 11 n=1 Tax=Allacma fusca TaxID=39272 RepID=A0A8J2Q5P2_9HEXA|nr:unnamed protein product [Allacma fusca]
MNLSIQGEIISSEERDEIPPEDRIHGTWRFQEKRFEGCFQFWLCVQSTTMALTDEGRRILGNRVAVDDVRMMRSNFNTIFVGPDGENFLYKNKIMLKYTSLTTLLAAVADVTLNERKGVVPVVRRTIFYAYPIIGGGLAYTFTLNTLASIRNEEHSLLNHFFAGQAAGAVVGAANKCFTTGVVMGIAIGFMGALYKNAKLLGGDLMPDVTKLRKEIGYPFSYKYDFTLVSDVPRRWVRELPKEES